MPDRTHPGTVTALRTARLNQSFPVRLCDEKDPQRACVEGVCTLVIRNGAYMFMISAVDANRETISFSQYREIILDWLVPPV